MEVIYSLISCFFINYILCWIWNLMGKGTSKNKFILVTVADALLLIEGCLSNIPFLIYSFSLEGLLFFLLSIGGTIGGYIITLFIISDGNKVVHLKSKRSREFSKALKMESERIPSKKKNAIVFGIGVLLLLPLSIYLFLVASNIRSYVIFGFSSLLFLTCLVLFLLSVVKTFKAYTIILLLETEDWTKVYSMEVVKQGVDYRASFQELNRAYMVSTYGIVKSKGNPDHFVLGLKIDSIDEEVLEKIKMESNKYSFYKKIKNEFSTSRKYIITMDGEYNSILEKKEVETLKI